MFFYDDDPVYFYFKGVRTLGLVCNVTCIQEYYENDNEEDGNRYHVQFINRHETNNIVLEHHQMSLADELFLGYELKVGDKVALKHKFPFKRHHSDFNYRLESLNQIAGRILTVTEINDKDDDDFRTVSYITRFEGMDILAVDYDIDILRTKNINLQNSSVALGSRPNLPIIE